METVTISTDDMNYIKNQFQLMADEIKRQSELNKNLELKIKSLEEKLKPKGLNEALGEEVFQNLGNFILNNKEN